MTNPLCFLQIWHTSLQMTFHRHNPKFFFVPTYPQIDNFADTLLSARETEISVNFLVGEINENFNKNDDFNEQQLEDSGEWLISFWTNDFGMSVGTPGREKIFVDEWDPLRGFRFQQPLFDDRIINLKGKVFRTVAFPYPPYAVIEEDCLDGVEMRIAQQFCIIYNCTIKHVYDGDFWGGIHDNGSSGSGVLGMVYTEEADIGFAANYLWLEPAFYIDYSDAWLHADVTLLVPKAQPLSGWKVPFLPFGPAMWIAFLLSLTVASIAVYFACLLIRDVIKRKPTRGNAKMPHLLDISLVVLGMSVLQAPPIFFVTNFTSIKQIITATAIMFLLLTSCYSAGLSSYLTVPQFTKPIDSIFELAESGLYWGAVHEAFVYSLIGDSDERVKRVVKHFIKMTDEELLIKGPTGKYGIAIERSPAGHFTEADYYTDEVISNSHVMKEGLFGSPVTFSLRKGSAYTKQINKLIRELLCSGLLFYWEGEVTRKFLTPRKQMALVEASTGHNKNEPITLKLSHVQGAFFLYGAGLVLSFAMVIAEIIHFKREGNNENKIERELSKTNSFYID